MGGHGAQLGQAAGELLVDLTGPNLLVAEDYSRAVRLLALEEEVDIFVEVDSVKDVHEAQLLLAILGDSTESPEVVGSGRPLEAEDEVLLLHRRSLQHQGPLEAPGFGSQLDLLGKDSCAEQSEGEGVALALCKDEGDDVEHDRSDVAPVDELLHLVDNCGED